MIEKTGNILGFIYEICMKLIDLATEAYGFMFQEINFIGLKVSFWQLLGGVGLAIILIAVIVKAVTPML